MNSSTATKSYRSKHRRNQPASGSNLCPCSRRQSEF